MRRMMLTVVVLCAVTITGVAQQPAPPRFEVASIKLWRPPTTPLTCQWRYNIVFSDEPPIPGPQEKANPDLPSFVAALQEQLGLRLERTRGPVPVVVIESVERPTPD